LWKSVLLGLVQGLTKILPVSSYGHLAIAEHYLKVNAPGVLLEVALHMGTLAAVFIYFRREIISLVKSFFLWGGSVIGRDPGLDGAAHAAWRLDLVIILGIILGSIPTGIMGVAAKDWIEGLFDRIDIVGVLLLVTAALLAIGELANRKRMASGAEGAQAPSWRQSIVIGFFQGAAIAPGISRSGSTVSAGLLMGIEPVAAARFSFLLGIPAMLGAAVLSLPDIDSVPAGQWAGYIAGAAAAAAVGYAAIAILIGALRRGKLFWFALYCFILGSVIITLSKIA